MKPILFNTDMVRAILEGRKTVTRRVIRPQPAKRPALKMCRDDVWRFEWWCINKFYSTKVPYCPGDILYVREGFQQNYDGSYSYRAGHKFESGGGWRPSIHMPREAARIFLRVTDVRVERLRDITELDILGKEGLTVDSPQPKPSYMSLAYTENTLKPAVKKAFAELWDSRLKPTGRAAIYGWGANPWVWVIEFERCEKPKGG